MQEYWAMIHKREHKQDRCLTGPFEEIDQLADLGYFQVTSGGSSAYAASVNACI